MAAMENSSLRFAAAARVLADEARRMGHSAPGFRSPPRIAGDRSIRRRADGGATVAIRYRGRPWAAVLADMVEGVVVANRLEGARAADVRAAAWRALETADAVPASRDRQASTVSALARVA